MVFGPSGGRVLPFPPYCPYMPFSLLPRAVYRYKQKLLQSFLLPPNESLSNQVMQLPPPPPPSSRDLGKLKKEKCRMPSCLLFPHRTSKAFQKRLEEPYHQSGVQCFPSSQADTENNGNNRETFNALRQQQKISRTLSSHSPPSEVSVKYQAK